MGVRSAIRHIGHWHFFLLKVVSYKKKKNIIFFESIFHDYFYKVKVMLASTLLLVSTMCHPNNTVIACKIM
jgi:hypothetical protein